MENSFGKNLYRYLSENNITVNEFAKKGKVKASQVKKWLEEKAELRCGTIIKISRAFNVSADYFLGISDNY